jgi:hypothetical protein
VISDEGIILPAEAERIARVSWISQTFPRRTSENNPSPKVSEYALGERDLGGDAHSHVTLTTASQTES